VPDALVGKRVKCPRCGKPVSVPAAEVPDTGPETGKPAGKAARTPARGVPPGMVASLFGAVLLGLGLFLPILSVWAGGISFFAYHALHATDSPIGLLLLVAVGACAVLGLLLGLLRQFVAVAVVGLAALAAVGTAAVLVSNHLARGTNASWSWGWGVLGAGVVLFLIVPLLPGSRGARKKGRSD
jgi:hypothetical protein